MEAIIGAPTITQYTVGAAASVLLATVTQANRIKIVNGDATNPIYIGLSDAVTSATGLKLLANTEIEWDQQAVAGETITVYAISTGGNVATGVLFGAIN